MPRRFALALAVACTVTGCASQPRGTVALPSAAPTSAYASPTADATAAVTVPASASPSPSPNAGAVVRSVTIWPSPINPNCDPRFVAAPTITAVVVDPDSPPADLRVTAQYSAGQRQGEIVLRYDLGKGAFVGMLPKLTAADFPSGRGDGISVKVQADDPPFTGSDSQPRSAYAALGCVDIGPRPTHT